MYAAVSRRLSNIPFIESDGIEYVPRSFFKPFRVIPDIVVPKEAHLSAIDPEEQEEGPFDLLIQSERTHPQFPFLDSTFGEDEYRFPPSQVPFRDREGVILPGGWHMGAESSQHFEHEAYEWDPQVVRRDHESDRQ